MASLVLETAKGRVVHRIARSMVVIGRDPACDLHLDAASVSRRHALLQERDGRIKITDLRSTAGTAINGAVLVPDRPSTLEDGDLVRIGKVQLVFHAQDAPAHPPPARRPSPASSRPLSPPPSQSPSPARSPAPRAPAPPPATPGRPSRLWQYLSVGLAVVVVALAAVVFALTRDPDRKPRVVILPAEARAEAEPAGPQPVAPDPEPAMPAPGPPAPAPEPEPDPPAEPSHEEAPMGELPPATDAPVERCPELFTLDDGRLSPGRLVRWNERVLEILGADGRLYRIARGQVSAVVDRVDLARRAEAGARGLAAADADGRLALARWCAERHLGAQARALATEVLAMRPDDAQARALLAGLEG